MAGPLEERNFSLKMFTGSIALQGRQIQLNHFRKIIYGQY
jgi:hypothetical protein